MLSGKRRVWQAANGAGEGTALASARLGVYISLVADRLLGALIFLPVPAVLWLFTRAPLGTVGSLGLGVLVMLTHRLYARPFVLARAGRRCLWCGGAAGDGPRLEVAEPLGTRPWRACSERHGERLARVLGWAGAHARFLRIGILGALGIFLLAMPFAGIGRLGPVTGGDVIAIFKLGVSLTVLPFGWLAAWRGRPAAETAVVPFPVHIQALIGTWLVLWLFRLVGVVWLFQAVAHFASRASR
jgi:hypothetical protein